MHLKTTKCLALLFVCISILHVMPMIFFYAKGHSEENTTSIMQQMSALTLGNMVELHELEA